jgi:hypothetical protein
MWEAVSAIAISVLATTAAISAVLAVRNLRQFNENLQLTTYTLLFKELSEERASQDRAIVRANVSPGDYAENIRLLVVAGRSSREAFDNAEVGKAIERTIASLDRVGAFLQGTKNKPRMEPPKWVWTLIRDFWGRLGTWVIYRQENSDDKEFWQEGYGFYFHKLAKTEQQRRKRRN